MDNSLYLAIFLLCIALSAFFSSSETAFVALQRVRLRHLEAQGVAKADLVAQVIKRPERFLATVLLGNNLANTTAAVLVTIVAISWWGQKNGMIIATLSVTLLLLVLGETIPKAIAAGHAERVALLYVRPIKLLSWLLSPFAMVLEQAGLRLSRAIGGASPPGPLLSEDEIRTVISVGHQEGIVKEAEAEMLHKVLEFGHRKAREIMTPRPQVIAIERETKLADFLSIYPQNPHSRFPIYEDSIDNMTGMLSIKDVLIAQAQGTIIAQSSLTELVRPVYFAPETKSVGELLAEMQSQSYQMAIIIDEFGGTAGIITLEQLIEEIVGELRDELAKPEADFTTIDERTFQIEGSLRLEEVNDKLGLQLPTGDYETVAGFLLHLLGHIPREGEQVKYNALRLAVIKMRGRKIEQILVTRE